MTRILDPTLAAAAAAVPLPRALRPRALHSLTVGLLANGKSNGMVLLDGIAERLRERHGIGEVVRAAKTNPSAPVSDEDAERLAKRCAVVITAIGD
jgi:hypothetical protein